MSEAVPDLQTLIDEREIGRKILAIADALDRRDWSEFESLFCADAQGDFGDGNLPKGGAAIVAMFRHFLGNCGPTQHLIGNIVVEITGDTAQSTCYVRDMHQGRAGLSHLHFSSPGRYRDRWLRTAEGWRLKERTKENFMFIGSIEALGLDK